VALYILKSFIKARSLFGQAINDFNPIETRLNIEYFFNPKSLVEGKPPMDRNCFSCLKIGHQTKDCPLITQKKKEYNEMMSEESTNANSIKCFKCHTMGHKAKDCTIEIKRLNSLSDKKCFNCNMVGHMARDCPESGLSQNYSNNFPPLTNANQIFNAKIKNMKINQQSAPTPKMISYINPSTMHTSINNPILIQTGENVCLVVNKNAANASTTINSHTYLNSHHMPVSQQSQQQYAHHQHHHHNHHQLQQQQQPQQQTQQVQYIIQQQKQSTQVQYQKSLSSSVRRLFI